MAAPGGNKFWLARNSHGRNPKFDSPEALWTACCEYFEWVEKHPLQEQLVFHFQGSITHSTVNKMRAIIISRLCLFLDISETAWCSFRNNEVLSSVLCRKEQSRLFTTRNLLAQQQTCSMPTSSPVNWDLLTSERFNRRLLT